MKGAFQAASVEGMGYDRLSDRAYATLHRGILEGKLTDGSRLTELKLCTQLKMGRSPVREALLRLASDGLVEAVPNAGFFVRCITLEDIEDSYQIRVALECLAVHLACQKGLSDLRLAEMEHIHGRFQQACASNDLTLLERLDLEFHQALVALAKSRRLESAVQSSHLQIFSWHYSHHTTLQQKTDPRVVQEHSALLGALRQRDAAKAEGVLRAHILGAFKESARRSLGRPTAPLNAAMAAKS